MSARRVVRERIDPRLTASLFANYRSAIDAVLETALREVCVTIPEATVPEFERKVNELMTVSIGLTERRRRSRRRPPVAKGAWAG